VSGPDEGLTLRFDVSGRDHQAIADATNARIEAYLPGQLWDIDVDAQPHALNGDGDVITWQARVLARHLGAATPLTALRTALGRTGAGR
jgi:hypothetical protein